MNQKLEELKSRKAAEAAAKLKEVQAAAGQEGVVAEAALPTAVVTAPKKADVKEETDPVEALAKIRIFRSRVPGSSYCMKEGYTIYFTGGWYETTDESEIEQLDKVANKTPTIYTDEHEAAIIAAVIEARKEGFAGSIGDAMTQQLSVEQRIAALRTANAGGSKPAGPLMLPTTGGIAQADAAKADAALKNAIKMAAQSNS